MNNDITVLPQLDCPNLSTLLLTRNGDSVLFYIENSMAVPSLKFPETFFSEMPALQVLDLSHSTFIRTLPSSLAELTNLRALYLQSLAQLRKIPPLTKLTKLQVLHLGGTSIEEIVGLEHCVDLRYLNLHETTELYDIQADALSKLTLLEELYVFRCVFFSECIPNLTQLERLAVVHMSFLSYEDYLKAMVNVNWNELKDFFINLRASPTGESFERVAHKTKVVQIDGLEIFKQLSSFCVPINTEALRIGHSVALPHLYKISCIKKLKSLKKLYLDFDFLSDCLLIGDEMEPNMFASLEGLRLRYWYNLQVICKSVLPSGCFNNLKIIYVDSCGRLKNLWSFKVLQQLKSIEVIKVTSSENIEEISSSIDEDDERDDTTMTEIVLPKLHSLHLWDLPRLQSISTRAWVCESLKIIAIFGCPGLRKFPFKRLPALENIYGTSEWWEAMEWDGPESKTLLQPYFVDRNANSREVTQIGEF